MGKLFLRGFRLLLLLVREPEVVFSTFVGSNLVLDGDFLDGLLVKDLVNLLLPSSWKTCGSDLDRRTFTLGGGIASAAPRSSSSSSSCCELDLELRTFTLFRVDLLWELLVTTADPESFSDVTRRIGLLLRFERLLPLFSAAGEDNVLAKGASPLLVISPINGCFVFFMFVLRSLLLLLSFCVFLLLLETRFTFKSPMILLADLLRFLASFASAAATTDGSRSLPTISR